MSGLNKDINSTEKLLNVIRGRDEKTFFREKKALSLSGKKPAKKSAISFAGNLFDKKNFVVGVDVGKDFICLVKTHKGNNAFLDHKIIKFSPDLSTDSAEFKSLLKSSLVPFCGAVNRCEIWTKISAGEVNVYFLKVPRVPKNQMDNVVYWTAKKEGFLDESRLIFDFEIQEQIPEEDKAKQSVMVYTAPKVEVEKIRALFSDIGVPLSGITTVPFAMQNLFRSGWMPASEEIFASLFIGENYSRIDVYDKENLVMTRGIKTGSSSSMAEAIVSSVMEKTGGLRLEKDEAKKILFSITPESEKLKTADGKKEFKKEEILEMISPVWERLARQVDLTLKTSSIGSKRVEKIYVLSAVSMDKSILNYMSNQLGTVTEFFDPFKQQKVSAAEQALSAFERILLSPALGLSLSCNSYTPNLVFTYVEKNKEQASQKFSKIALGSFVAALVICFGVLAYQGLRYKELVRQGEKFKKELALFNPLLTQETVLKASEDVKQQRSLARQYVQRYLFLATLGEISHITPQNIRLLNCKLTRGGVMPSTDASGQSKQEVADNILIEGLVFGERNALDSLLGQYVVTLGNSPIFGNVNIQKQEIVKFNNNDVMHFTLNAKIG